MRGFLVRTPDLAETVAQKAGIKGDNERGDRCCLPPQFDLRSGLVPDFQ